MTVSESTPPPVAAARKIPARGNLRGMTVEFEGETWEVLDRHPKPAHWWIHRRRGSDNKWITDYARSTRMKQVIT